MEVARVCLRLLRPREGGLRGVRQQLSSFQMVGRQRDDGSNLVDGLFGEAVVQQGAGQSEPQFGILRRQIRYPAKPCQQSHEGFLPLCFRRLFHDEYQLPPSTFLHGSEGPALPAIGLRV